MTARESEERTARAAALSCPTGSPRAHDSLPTLSVSLRPIRAVLFPFRVSRLRDSVRDATYTSLPPGPRTRDDV